MLYGIRPTSLRNKLTFDIIEDINADNLINKGCTGVFINKADAEWIVELIMNDSKKGE